MFGLKSPLRSCQETSEFDNVNTIFSQSSFKEPVYQTSPWLEKADEKGEIFSLEVERFNNTEEGDCLSDIWEDNQSLNSRFPCSNSEDTGYSSDNDIQPSPKTQKSSKIGNRLSQFLRRKEVKLFDERNIDESIDASSACDCVECRLDIMSTYIKEVLLLIDSDSKCSRIVPGSTRSKTSVCEYVLGIIPGGYQGQQFQYNGVQEPVYIKGLSPEGPAIKVKDIHIGDWLKSINGQEVTRNNLDVLLSSLSSSCKVQLILQSMPSVQSLSQVTPVGDADQLISVINGDNMSDDLITNQSMVLYTSLEGLQSENSKDKEDVLYQYPKNEGLFLALRGMCYTLCHTVKDFTNTSVLNSSVVLKGEVFNICYHSEGKDLLVFAVSEKRISSYLLNILKEEVLRLLQVLFGSVESAFKTMKYRKQLNHIFGVVFKCGLGGEPMETSSPSLCSINRLLSHSGHVQYLPLPQHIMLNLNNILSEFEAGDFVEMSDSYYGLRRSYTILGSCLFYKDNLLCSHLNKEHLSDISLYLQYHGLLPLTTKCPLNQLVIWREVYPTQFCCDVSGINNVFGYSEPDARWFLLIVGLKYSIYAVLLEAGGCSVRRRGVTLPDPFYIDQAKATLLQTLTVNYTSVIESRLSGNGLPCVISAGNIHSKSHSILDLTNSLSKLGQKRHDDIDPPPRYPRITSPRHTVFQRKASVESDGSSGSSNDSMFKSSRTSRLFVDLHNPVINNNKWLEDTSFKLSQGADNSIFHFCHFDSMEGIYIRAIDKAGESVNQSDLINNFYRCCCQVRQMFQESRDLKKLVTNEREVLFYPEDNLVNIKEHGVLFQCSSISDSKKNKHQFSYWVVGRKLSRGNRKEIYLCFLDSTPQNVIETAFKLGFNKTCPG